MSENTPSDRTEPSEADTLLACRIVAECLTAVDPDASQLEAFARLDISAHVASVCREKDADLAALKQSILDLSHPNIKTLLADIAEAKALVSERESRLANIKFLLEPIYGSTNYAPIGGTIDRVLNICDDAIPSDTDLAARDRRIAELEGELANHAEDWAMLGLDPASQTTKLLVLSDANHKLKAELANMTDCHRIMHQSAVSQAKQKTEALTTCEDLRATLLATQTALEQAKADTVRLDWLEARGSLAIWCGVMTDSGLPVVDLHEPREEGWDDACGEELGSGKTLRAAIDASAQPKQEGT